MSGIQVKKLGKRFGEVEVLQPLNVEIQPGEFCVLVGPSGCGKSTFLRLIAGLEEPSEGEIHIGGHNVTFTPPKDRKVAMVFQSYALYPHLSVAKNLVYPLDCAKVSEPEKKLRVLEIAELLEITSLLDRKPKELSGGQRQRVAIGRALVRKPEVFLFDEPLSNLDARLREQTRREIAALHKKLGITTLYVTHDQQEAMTLAERILVLSDGVVMGQGRPDELYHNPPNLFTAEFLGHPPLNVLPAELSEEGIKIGKHLQALQTPPQYRGACLLGIRPEVLSLEQTPQTSLKLHATIELIEDLGRELFVKLRLDNHTLWATLAEKPTSDTITLWMKESSLLFFDPQTEQRIPHE